MRASRFNKLLNTAQLNPNHYYHGSQVPLRLRSRPPGHGRSQHQRRLQLRVLWPDRLPYRSVPGRYGHVKSFQPFVISVHSRLRSEHELRQRRRRELLHLKQR